MARESFAKQMKKYDLSGYALLDQYHITTEEIDKEVKENSLRYYIDPKRKVIFFQTEQINDRYSKRDISVSEQAKLDAAAAKEKQELELALVMELTKEGKTEEEIKEILDRVDGIKIVNLEDAKPLPQLLVPEEDLANIEEVSEGHGRE